MRDYAANYVDEIRAWLAENWRDVLGGTIEPDGDFFVAGGSSLLAAKLAARIREAGYRDVGLADLLEHRLFDAQVELLVNSEWREGAAREQRDPVAGLASAQRNRLEIVRERVLAGEPPPPYPIQLVVALHGPVDVAALDRAARALVGRHAALRTRFLASDGALELTECELADDWHVFVHDLTELDAEDGWLTARELAHEQNNAVIDYSRPPLVVVSISILPRDRSLLTLTVDHLVADGISMGVLWRDLDELYDAEATGRCAELPPLRITAQQVLGEREKTWREDRERILAAWDHALAGYELPPLGDLVRPSLHEEFRPPQPAAHHGWELSGDVVSGFLAGCLTTEVTEHAAAIGLVFHALHMLDDRTDAVICTAQWGRLAEDEEDLVGWLSDLIIVRIGPGLGAPAAVSLAEVARHTQERLRFAYRHPVPYHVLVRRYQGTVGARAPRKPYIFVNYSDRPMIGPRLGAARTEPVVDKMPLTNFPGPGIHIERDADRIAIDMSVVAGRYPPGVVETFGSLLCGAFTAFAADPRSRPAATAGVAT